MKIPKRLNSSSLCILGTYWEADFRGIFFILNGQKFLDFLQGQSGIRIFRSPIYSSEIVRESEQNDRHKTRSSGRALCFAAQELVPIDDRDEGKAQYEEEEP